MIDRKMFATCTSGVVYWQSIRQLGFFSLFNFLHRGITFTALCIQLFTAPTAHIMAS